MADGTPLPEVEYAFDCARGAGWRPLLVNAREGVSELYEANILLVTRSLNENPDDLFEELAGLEIRREGLSRRIRGVVRRVEDLGTTGGYRFARVTIVPHLWTLGLRQNSRIWQDVNIITILRELFKDVALYQGDLLGVDGSLEDLPPREYCVQYRETDLAFVLRLLEEEGVPYYFRHDGEKESLILAGDDHNWEQVPTMDGGPIELMDQGVNTASAETVQWFDWHSQMRSTGVVLRDYDFTHPRSVIDMTPKHPGASAGRTVYDYPAGFNLGPFDDGAHMYGPHHGVRRARVRFEEAVDDVRTTRGRGNVSGFLPGRQFQLQGHLRGDLDRKYLLLGVEHVGTAWGDITDEVRQSEHVRAVLRDVELDAQVGDGPAVTNRYFNRFYGVAADVKVRPARVTARPIIPGAQTALVMAAKDSDEEIETDFYGRILCRFHWEQPEQRGASQRTKNASCWIRVAQTWAGAAWGSMFIPRVGMEVVVSFLEGDPDRPLVTGCVYNGENHTPYPLPSEKTKSTIKTMSSKGGGGFNELRFEDLKDAEQIFVHAQKDMDTVVRHDETLTVGHDRTKTIQGMEYVTVQKDRISSILQNESLEVDGNQTIAIHGGTGASMQVDSNYVLHAEKKIGFTVGDSSIVMTPSQITISSKTINVLGDSLVKIKGGLVKINCDDGPKEKVAAEATTAALSRNLIGEPGDLLKRVKDLLDPEKVSEAFTKGLDKVLTKAGVPENVRQRLNGVAQRTVKELTTALKEGRKPDWAGIRKDLKGVGEQVITDTVKSVVTKAFEPLLNNPRVQNSRVLRGMVTEIQNVTITSATYGILRAANLRDGMARDPFWSVLKAKHGESISALLKEHAIGAGTAKLREWIDGRSLPPWAQKLADKAAAQLEKALGSNVEKLLMPG
ncbi:MAG: type VI secretion system tip protein TssI/VgrG [Polyangiales bacterium]